MQPHANTRPHPQGRGGKDNSQGGVRRKGPRCSARTATTRNTQTRRGGLSRDCARLQTLLFSLSLFLLPPRFLSFARLPTSERKRKRKSAERPGQEMYCTFLRTRCIDCHTSVPEKRHCAIERCWALCFPLAPEAGGKGERVEAPAFATTGITASPRSPVRS